MPLWIRAAALCCIPVSPLPVWADASFRVVVNESNPIPELNVGQISKIFLKKVSRWSNGVEAQPVDLPESSPTREIFTQAVHHRTVANIKNFWQRQMFSGNERPPIEQPDETAVLEYVRQNPGAIGYVSSETPLVAGVRHLKVSDCTGCAEPDGDEPPWSGAQDAGVSASRGDVFLLATARCGPGQSGHRMVLQNRSLTQSVAVTVERRLDVRGQRKSRHTEHYALWPGEEQELGCTAVGQDTIETFSLREVSDASFGDDPVMPEETVRAARDLLTFTEAEACGGGGEGRTLVLYNTHGRQSVSATVEYVQEIDGHPHRRFRKSHLLGPGAQKELGCSQDGSMTLAVALVEAELR